MSVLGLGFGNVTEASTLELDAIFDRAVRAGINVFDVADVYGLGRAEQALGGLMRGHARHRLVIATKVCSPMSDDCNDQGLSRKHLREAIEGSLERLETRYVDLYLCHDIDEQTPLEETAWTMDQLIREGKCLYWGVSNWPFVWIERALQVCRERGLCPPIVDQSQYNLLNERAMHHHVEEVTDAGLGFLAWGPLASGVLTGKYFGNRSAPGRLNTERFAFLQDELLTAESDHIVAGLLARARERGTTPARLAIAELVSNPRLSSVLLGVTSPEQLDELLGRQNR
ncbi:aldo/keto reductase [Paraliomyxa miuraensis]|nr:aldo/keto reductase [Paraliomyxa miuraensis]